MVLRRMNYVWDIDFGITDFCLDVTKNLEFLVFIACLSHRIVFVLRDVLQVYVAMLVLQQFGQFL